MKLFKFDSFRNIVPRSLDLRKSNQSGQAIIEYILIVIISVTMLFVAKGFFSNVNTYISGYIGGYFKCLMTQGELPALGVSDSENLAKHKSAGYKCSAELKKTDIANQGGDGTKNVGTTTQLSKDKPQGATKVTASSRGGYSSSSSKKSGLKRRGGSGSSGDEGGDDSTRFSANVRNRSEAYSSSDDGGDQEGSRSSRMATRDLSSEKSSGGYRPSGEMESDINKKTRGGGISRRDNASKQTLIVAVDDMRPGPRRLKLNPPTRAVTAVVEEPEVEMGFGYFMKWIIIAGIVIAIFILFGGQIMNYNNSDSG